MSPLQFDNRKDIQLKLDEKACDLFRAKPGVPQLQIVRNCKRSEQIIARQDIYELSDITACPAAGSDESQIFFIRQDRSWTTLNCSREVFESFLSRYEVFPQLWRCMFTFGRKTEENELEFPNFRSRRTPFSDNSITDIYQSAYMLRRVELHHRALEDGQSPWSIRQTGVYRRLAISALDQKLDSPRAKSTILLVAPSQNVDRQLCNYDELNTALASCNIQRLLVADSLKNWMEYMAYLEDQLREQSDRIVVANVGTKRENLSPLTDFNINFADRQTLKILEDSVIDLQIILSTMFTTITRIREDCKSTCAKMELSMKESQELEVILDELDEYAREAEMYMNRGRALKDKAYSTAQLLSDLLSYEEAVALKDLTSETQQESKAMMGLTERSTKDAAAMKVLTIITLIYLPTSIVFVSCLSPSPFLAADSYKNFFSTQFVATTEQGRMILSNNVWLLAVIAIPLTFITITLWATWVYFTKVPSATVDEKNKTLPAILRRRQNSFRSIMTSRRTQQPGTPKLSYTSSFASLFSPKKKLTQRDLESGLVTTDKVQSTGESPVVQFHEVDGTWSSTSTTTKV